MIQHSEQYFASQPFKVQKNSPEPVLYSLTVAQRSQSGSSSSRPYDAAFWLVLTENIKEVYLLYYDMDRRVTVFHRYSVTRLYISNTVFWAVFEIQREPVKSV